MFEFNKKKFYELLPKVDIFFLTFPNQISDEDFTLNEFNKILKKYKNKNFLLMNLIMVLDINPLSNW